MNALQLQLQGFRLTTADILYHLPDHPDLLQQFIWQELDKAPDYPRLTKFLDFWDKNLDGPLHSVRVGSVELIKPAELRYADAEFRLN